MPSPRERYFQSILTINQILTEPVIDLEKNTRRGVATNEVHFTNVDIEGKTIAKIRPNLRIIFKSQYWCIYEWRIYLNINQDCFDNVTIEDFSKYSTG